MRKSEAQSLAIAEMRKHGLILAGWRLKFDNAKMRFGKTTYSRKVISLSAPLVALNDEDTILDTIRHEIAHALVGYGHGHDSVWRSTARAIGGSGKRQKAANTVETPPARYIVSCPKCSFSIPRHRRANKLQACPRCCNRYNGGRFSMDYVLVWHLNTSATARTGA